MSHSAIVLLLFMSKNAKYFLLPKRRSTIAFFDTPMVPIKRKKTFVVKFKLTISYKINFLVLCSRKSYIKKMIENIILSLCNLQ